MWTIVNSLCGRIAYKISGSVCTKYWNLWMSPSLLVSCKCLVDNPWQHYSCFSLDIVWPCLTFGNCMELHEIVQYRLPRGYHTSSPRLHRWRTGPRNHNVEAVQLTPRQRLLWPYLRRGPTSGRTLFNTIRNYHYPSTTIHYSTIHYRRQPSTTYQHATLQTNVNAQ